MTGRSVCLYCVYVDAVLSQNLTYQQDDFLYGNRSLFDQTRYHLNVGDCCFINSGFTTVDCLSIRTRFRQTTIAPGVYVLFLDLALFAAIIFKASLYRIFTPVSLPATKWTAKITTCCIPRMGEKYYVAVPAPSQAFSQVGLFFENRTNNPIIPRNIIANISASIPLRVELKKRLNLDYKKAKCLLMSLMYCGMPSLYLLEIVVIFRYNEGSSFVKHEFDFYSRGTLTINCINLSEQGCINLSERYSLLTVSTSTISLKSFTAKRLINLCAYVSSRLV